jgi:hypothetical protein
MSDNRSFVATGYLMLALHACSSSSSFSSSSSTSYARHGSIEELARYLLPVLESKTQTPNSSLTKDEAFFLSEMYQHGLGCPPNTDKALEMATLSRNLLTQFRQEPEMKSREKLISLHLQLLEHSVNCTAPCASKNCQKMKVPISPLPLPSLVPPSSLTVGRISWLTHRPAPLDWLGVVSIAVE